MMEPLMKDRPDEQPTFCCFVIDPLFETFPFIFPCKWAQTKDLPFFKTAFACCFFLHLTFTCSFTFSYLHLSLNCRVVGAPQMTPQPVSFICFCAVLFSGTWRSPGLSIPWFCLPTSSSVCLIFFPLLLCLARWFWPDLMNWRCVHTTSVYISLRCGCVCVIIKGGFHNIILCEIILWSLSVKGIMI